MVFQLFLCVVNLGVGPFIDTSKKESAVFQIYTFTAILPPVVICAVLCSALLRIHNCETKNNISHQLKKRQIIFLAMTNVLFAICKPTLVWFFYD